MKRNWHLSSVILLAVGCAPDPAAPPPAGSPSGDQLPVPGGPRVEPMPPALPDSPCDHSSTAFGLETLTLFGGTPEELLERVAPIQDSPLFWVPFDGLPGTVFTPGADTASIRLDLSLRSGLAEQVLWQPKDTPATCPIDTLQVPVRVSLRSSDGAFDEKVDSWVEFTSANTGQLRVALPATLEGSFAFDQIGVPGENWQVDGFQLDVDLWPGGNRGELVPSFSRVDGGSPSPPSRLPPVAPLLTGTSMLVPSVPDHWGSIAVWPRRESCDGEPRGEAVAFAPEDRIIGWSPADVVSELNGRSAWTLTSVRGATPLQFTLDAPVGIQCVRASGRSMIFDVVGRLRAAAAAGSPLEHFDAFSVFELSVTSARNGLGLERLRWLRRDVAMSQDRAAFEAATGLTLAAPAEYREVWWSWHGVDVRERAADAWSAQGRLVVSSLNVQQSAEIAGIVAQGGPGAGISFDNATQFPELPGDELIDASSAP